ncbi:MAG: hypothetical protein JWN03_7865 [Nocardia sp.]|uniref:hypothetical protein n=1 Tax=Nocardia sp. TaxID=1821 RepID=UPI0026290C60|nr:hypothetical protein [Nocardia sp.]MCU1647590.1 hypothetical protein [Nocardia sp.]
MTTTLNPSIIGQVEKHHTAILTRALAGTSVDEKQWITLNQALAADAPVERTAHIARVAGMTQWPPASVETALVALVGAGLVAELPGARIEVPDAGRALVAQVRGETGAIVERAYSTVSAEDRAIAARVLVTITARLADELAHV